MNSHLVDRTWIRNKCWINAHKKNIRTSTLLSKTSAHWFHQVLRVTQNHLHSPLVILSWVQYEWDHLTNSTWPGVTFGELDEINVHFFWRRVYELIFPTPHWISLHCTVLDILDSLSLLQVWIVFQGNNCFIPNQYV